MVVIEKMNNKGFTLIELLATVVILSLVLGIAAHGVMGAINNSKTRGEELFVTQLSKMIDGYVEEYGSSLQVVGSTYTFSKKNNLGNSTYSVEANQVKNGGRSIYVLDLVNGGFIDEKKLINPKNKKECFNQQNNPEIKVYCDSDFVYYYSVDLSNNLCGIEQDHIKISTLPSELKDKIGG